MRRFGRDRGGNQNVCQAVVVARYRQLRSVHCEHAGICTGTVDEAGPLPKKFMHLLGVRYLAKISLLAIISPIELECCPGDIHPSFHAGVSFWKWERKYPASHSWLGKAKLCFLQFHHVKPPFVGDDRRIYTHGDQEIACDDEGTFFRTHPLEQFDDDLVHAPRRGNRKDIGKRR